MKHCKLLSLFVLPGLLLAACAQTGTPARFSLVALQLLSPLDILVQQDYEPTFPSGPEAFFEFGRVPPFTLLADSTVIYLY